MKKFIVLFLLLFVTSAFAQVEIDQVEGQDLPAGGVITIACDACRPGTPNRFCEDYENAGSPWCAWTNNFSGGNSVTYGTHPGTFICQDRGVTAANIFWAGTNLTGYKERQIGAREGSEHVFYFNIESSQLDEVGERLGAFQIVKQFGTKRLWWYINYRGAHHDIHFCYAQTGGGNSCTDLGAVLLLNTWYEMKVSAQGGANITVQVSESSSSQLVNWTSSTTLITESDLFFHVRVGVQDQLGGVELDGTDQVQLSYDILFFDDVISPGSCTGW